LERQVLCDGSGKSRLAVVNVTDRANIYVRFCSFKFLLCHFDRSSNRFLCPAVSGRILAYFKNPRRTGRLAVSGALQICRLSHKDITFFCFWQHFFANHPAFFAAFFAAYFLPAIKSC
jgi:hypothetical protein